MPQSKVIDVNTQVTLATNNYWAARASRNRSITENCINVANAMLDKKHRFTFDTEGYDSIEHTIHHACCYKCNVCTRVKITDDNVKRKPHPTNPVSHLATHTLQWYNYVECTVCSEEIILTDDTIEETANHDITDSLENHFLPEPPQINNILDHVVYSSKYWAWTDLVWAALMKRHQHQREAASNDDLGEDPTE